MEKKADQKDFLWMLRGRLRVIIQNSFPENVGFIGRMDLTRVDTYTKGPTNIIPLQLIYIQNCETESRD